VPTAPPIGDWAGEVEGPREPESRLSQEDATSRVEDGVTEARKVVVGRGVIRPLTVALNMLGVLLVNTGGRPIRQNVDSEKLT
jgi:hypothetical protein